VTAIFQSCN